MPTLDLKKQYIEIKDEIDRELQRVVDNTAFILGPAVERFEKSFADYCNVKECIGVNSGTAALQLLYEALGISSGDEVITTPFTFIATVEPLVHMGAKPVFVDIDPDTYNLDPELVEAKITENTRAIMAVHLYGHPAPLDQLKQLCEKHDLILLEDAAQSHGALYRGDRVGGLSRGAAFRFYPGKNLGAFGDAGAVTTNDSALASQVRDLRDHGRAGKYSHIMLGHNERMDGFQGAVLDVKLKYLEAWNAGRQENADFYNSALEELPAKTPIVAEYAEHVYHQYVIQVEQRDRVVEQLREAGIGAGVHYPVPLHLQPGLKTLGCSEGDLPVSEEAARHVLSLPVFSLLSADQKNYLVKQLQQILG